MSEESEESALFWKGFETETGEKVEARSEGIWYNVPGNNARHEGLLILTDKSFRFKYIPNTRPPYMGLSYSSESQNQTEFTLARGDIVSARLPRRGFLGWLFRRNLPLSAVVARGRDGEKTYTFSSDPATGLIAALGKAWPARPV
jgi:hypothetical protein